MNLRAQRRLHEWQFHENILGSCFPYISNPTLSTRPKYDFASACNAKVFSIVIVVFVVFLTRPRAAPFLRLYCFVSWMQFCRSFPKKLVLPWRQSCSRFQCIAWLKSKSQAQQAGHNSTSVDANKCAFLGQSPSRLKSSRCQIHEPGADRNLLSVGGSASKLSWDVLKSHHCTFTEANLSEWPPRWSR